MNIHDSHLFGAAVRGFSEASGCISFVVAEDDQLRRNLRRGGDSVSVLFSEDTDYWLSQQTMVLNPDPVVIEGEQMWRLWVWERHLLS